MNRDLWKATWKYNIMQGNRKRQEGNNLWRKYKTKINLSTRLLPHQKCKRFKLLQVQRKTNLFFFNKHPFKFQKYLNLKNYLYPQTISSKQLLKLKMVRNPFKNHQNIRFSTTSTHIVTIKRRHSWTYASVIFYYEKSDKKSF